MKPGRVLSIVSIICLMTCANQAFAYDDYDEYRPNPYYATSSRYDYVYANPPRHSLGAYGRYIHSSAKVRYVHSPSRLKGAKHAARINAYNMQAYNY